MSQAFPGNETLLAITRTLPAPILVVGARDLAARLPSQSVPAPPAATTRAPAPPPASLACPFPSRFGPLVPTLQRLRALLPAAGRAVVSDLVWQTAPTAELARALAPQPGADKIRPIEGYEMQLEHAGFEIAGRTDVPASQWHAFYRDGPIAGALAGDHRGAARLAVWLLRCAD